MSCIRSSATAISILGALCGPWSSSVSANIDPEWILRYNVGSALAAGLQDMVTDADGVSYVTGITGPSGNTDILTAAYGPDGTLLWSDIFNGPADWHDQGRGITLGPEGVVYVTGNTPGPGNYANVVLLKYDAASGELLNTVQYSSGPFTSEHGASVATDAQRNVYVGGGTVGDGSDGLIVSFNADGQFRWMRTYDGPAAAPFSQDHVRKVMVDPQGDVIAMIDGVMSSLHPDYVVIKYAANSGAIVWQTNWGMTGGDFPNDMKIDSQGDIYVTGRAFSFTDQFGTIKLRGLDGELLWQAYDSAGIDDGARALALDGEGGVYITGAVDPDGDESNFNDNIYTVKRDAASGALLWTHLYGANCIGCFDVPADVIVDSAGNVFVAGSTSSPPYSGDVILLALEASSGAEIDRGIIFGETNEHADAGILRFDAVENIYMGGEFYNVNTGVIDIFVVKYAAWAGIPADLNGDGTVGPEDLAILLGSWGPCGDCGDCPADLDGDCAVGAADLALLLGNWGEH